MSDVYLVIIVVVVFGFTALYLMSSAVHYHSLNFPGQASLSSIPALSANFIPLLSAYSFVTEECPS